MQISITARHFDLTPGLKEHTQDRLERMTKYGVPLLEAHAVLMVEKYRHNAEVTLHGKGFHIAGHAESEDMYQSVDQACQKLEEQIRRHKDKIQDKHKGEKLKEMAGESDTDDDDEDED